MRSTARSGRTFAGRVLQVVTGSAGLDDFEWGVTLFGVHPDDLKEVVYTMRYDRASAIYAEFGPFYTGMVTPVEELLAGTVGVRRPGGRGRSAAGAPTIWRSVMSRPAGSNRNRS